MVLKLEAKCSNPLFQIARRKVLPLAKLKRDHSRIRVSLKRTWIITYTKWPKSKTKKFTSSNIRFKLDQMANHSISQFRRWTCPNKNSSKMMSRSSNKPKMVIMSSHPRMKIKNPSSANKWLLRVTSNKITGSVISQTIYLRSKS